MIKNVVTKVGRNSARKDLLSQESNKPPMRATKDAHK